MRVFLVALAVLAGTESVATPRRVLLIHSFGRDVDAHAAFAREFRTELATASERPVEFYEVSLKSALLGGAASESRFVEYLDAYDAEDRFDLVVTLGGPAARFVQRHRHRLFETTPMLIGGTDGRHLLGGELSGLDAVVPFRIDFAAIVDNILRVLPETKEIFVVIGRSPLEQFWLETILKETSPFLDRVRITPLDALPLARILERAESAKPGTAIFYATMIEDAAGVPYGEASVLAALHAASKAPIFGVWDDLVGKGAVGGPVISIEVLARESARVASRILDGEPPSRFRSAPTTVNRIAFDASELDRWRIPRSRLLAASEVRFEKPSMWALYHDRILLLAAFLVGQGLLIVWLVTVNARARRAEAEIRQVSGRLVAAQEDERARLARELHDDVTQQIARLAIDAGRVEGSGALGKGPMAETVRDLRVGLVKLSEHVHVLAYSLHPSLLDDLGLLEAIRAEADRVAQHWAIDVDVVAEQLPDSTPANQARCLYRVAQEAMRNVVRHARARAVRVRLEGERRGIRLTVKDDGIGFDVPPAGHSRTLGLASMRERVRIAGGSFTVASVPGTGTTVDVWVPLEEIRP